MTHGQTAKSSCRIQCNLRINLTPISAAQWSQVVRENETVICCPSDGQPRAICATFFEPPVQPCRCRSRSSKFWTLPRSQYSGTESHASAFTPLRLQLGRTFSCKEVAVQVNCSFKAHPSVFPVMASRRHRNSRPLLGSQWSFGVRWCQVRNRFLPRSRRSVCP